MGKDLQGNGLIYLKVTNSYVMAYGILYSYYVLTTQQAQQ